MAKYQVFLPKTTKNSKLVVSITNHQENIQQTISITEKQYHLEFTVPDDCLWIFNQKRQQHYFFDVEFHDKKIIKLVPELIS